MLDQGLYEFEVGFSLDLSGGGMKDEVLLKARKTRS